MQSRAGRSCRCQCRTIRSNYRGAGDGYHRSGCAFLISTSCERIHPAFPEPPEHADTFHPAGSPDAACDRRAAVHRVGAELVIAQCKAGIVGAFPALNARPKELLEEWLQRITTELRRIEGQASRPARWRPSPSTRSCTAPTTACSTTSISARNTRCRSRSPRCARPTTW